MVEPQSSRFWRSAVQSGLADDDALRACWDAIPEEKRTADSVDRRLARQAVNSGLVTVWQAQQLLAGRAAGFQIDRYVLLDLIGQGGMGRVYLARDTRLNRKVAIKILSKERMTNPRALTRFQREAKVGAQLQHENLVRIYDEGESSGIRYLVMEFIDGKNIAQLIAEQGAIPWPAAARLARQVALGLEHAQKKGLIHRDVNPSNILVTHDGTAKLTDLGLAIDLADEANVTRDGATVGTFDYISPEQAKHSREVDTRADIYSLGCSLYHMIAGRVPFAMPSLPEKLYAHQLHEATPLDEAVADVPEGLARVVQMMMRKDPDERQQTPQAVAQALEPFADEATAVETGLSSSGSLAIDGKTRVAAAVRAGAPAIAPPPIESPRPISSGTIAAPAAEAAPAGTPRSGDLDLSFLAVDVGPAGALTEGLSTSARGKPKPRSGADGEAAPPRVAETRAGPGPRAWVPVALGLAVVLASVVAIAAMVWMSRDRLRRDDAGPETEAVGDAPPAQGAGAKAVKIEPGQGPAILVVGRDGTSRPAADLKEAVAIAIGGRGDVVLNPSGPLRISPGEIRVPRGSVTIRAAEGTAPVVAVDVDGPRSVLVGTAGTSITLRGLRVVAHYRPMDRPSALIESGGSVTIDRCTFVASGATANSRAVKADGLKLSVDGSLFAGFDRALEVDAFPDSVLTVRRSMLVRAGASEGASGWAIKVQYAGSPSSGKPSARPPRVVLDRVTVQGAGLLDLSNFAPDATLAVEADHALIQARSLLAYAPRRGEAPEAWAKAVKWSGKGNRYDVTGTAWVVLSAGGELPAPNAPGEIEGWKSAVGSDRDSTAGSFKVGPSALAADPSALAPAEFAPAGDGLGGIGADPKDVGPPPVDGP